MWIGFMTTHLTAEFWFAGNNQNLLLHSLIWNSLNHGWCLDNCHKLWSPGENLLYAKFCNIFHQGKYVRTLLTSVANSNRRVLAKWRTEFGPRRNKLANFEIIWAQNRGAAAKKCVSNLKVNTIARISKTCFYIYIHIAKVIEYRSGS